MALLVFIFLLTFLPEPAVSGHLPKAAISSPVFGPRQVYGLLDGTVVVKCFYPSTKANRHDRKYWCKESSLGCVTIASTSGYVAADYQGRVAITDYPQAKHFQINISGLAMADTGNYQCGVGINGRGLSHKVNLEVSKGPHIPEGAGLFYVKLHSTVTMACSFGEEAASVRKFLCKMSKSSCYNIIDSYGNIDEDYRGRVLLTNKEPAGSFSIVITQMGWEDSGLYLCGYGVYGEQGETKELDVHVYEETSVPQGKSTIIGVKGSSVTFECHYEPVNRLSVSSVKYLCKWRESGCARIIDNTGFVAPIYEGRVTMYDSPGNKTISVILNQLKDSDKGYYWCMTDEENEQQSSMELKIIDGEPGLKGKTEVEAQVGSRVDLTCSYPCKYYSYQKYWCKWNSAGCKLVPSSDQSQPGTGVTCDTDNKTVILSFDSVTKDDEGWYWCGVKHNNIFDETMAVHLQVTEGTSDGNNLELMKVDTPSHAKPPSHAEPPSHVDPNSIPRGRASSDAAVQQAEASESSQSHGSNTLVLPLTLTCAVVLVLVTAFAIFKYRQLKRSDLVSVGSYRTNISMSDFESVKEYGANNNPCMKESQETQMGVDELITPAAPPEDPTETKKAKRSSKEDADIAYSTFLLTSSSMVQDNPGEDSSVPDVPPQNK